MTSSRTFFQGVGAHSSSEENTKHKKGDTEGLHVSKVIDKLKQLIPSEKK
ncbi:MAG: hypothetical protein UZ21_OP11001000155 [Microgenomates bacterium OLB22]|nr:MAG: hypothetical protein UZ21_OP11001000155 [Microgenomates bacterium OLB22]